MIKEEEDGENDIENNLLQVKNLDTVDELMRVL
jgi:hypothetical protein